MIQTAQEVGNTQELNQEQFEALTAEALRIIRLNKRIPRGIKYEALRKRVKDLKETTANTISVRLSASQR